MSRLAPPRLAEWVLRLILRTPDREYILGDLAQQYHERRVAGTRARLWYWSQLARAVPAMAWRFAAQQPRTDGPALLRGDSTSWIDARSGRGGTMRMTGLWNDVRFVGRGLLRAPGFTLIVIGTLALAIGANTAIFSVVDGVLLRPLPHPDADRLVTVTIGRIPSPGRGADKPPHLALT